MNILTPEELQESLHSLNVAWSAIPGDGLVRVIDTQSFAEGVDLINKVAAVADLLDHHPDISLHTDKVEIATISHDESGITKRDITLARAIDQIVLT